MDLAQFSRILKTLQQEPRNPQCIEPTQWISSNSDILGCAIEHLPATHREFANTLTTQIFPRLHILTFGALLIEPANEEGISALQSFRGRWSKGVISDQFPHHQSINELLAHLLSSRRLSDLQVPAQAVMDLDVQHLEACVFIVLSVNDTRKRCLSTVQNAVPTRDQNLVDLFQSLLDRDILPSYRPSFLRALFKLSKRTGLFPRSLVHNNVVVVESSTSIIGGSFGDIWRGSLCGKPVAMKVMRTIKSTQEILKSYSREAIVWSQLHHPNVLPFYGIYCWLPHRSSPERMALLSPWIDNGNAVEYLSSRPQVERLPIVLDIGRGLHYLHTFTPPIVHGDLKGNNILITSEGKACLADFGLSKLISDSTWTSSPLYSTQGNELFTAPELLFCELDAESRESSSSLLQRMRKTTESDVYAFGCVCYEIYEGLPRFSNLVGPWRRLQAVQKNESCPRPNTMPEGMWRPVQLCWLPEPASRPTVASFLKEIGIESWETHESTSETQHIEEWDGRANPRVRLDAFKIHLSPPTLDPTLAKSSTSLEDSTTDSNTAGSTVTLEPPTNPYESLTGQTFKARNLSAQLPHKITLIPQNSSEHQFKEDDMIIALMGPTGTGKSTYINDLMGAEVAAVGHGVEPCTNEIGIYGCEHPNDGSRRVFIVDTPGFDRVHVSDQETLKTIAQWLSSTYKRRIALSGVIYFYSIAEARVKGTERSNMNIFQKLCGPNALKNVVVVTTCWEELEPESQGIEREREFRTSFLRNFIGGGGRYQRYRRLDAQSAMRGGWDLVDMFDNDKRPLLVQDEMVTKNKSFFKTSAYRALKGLSRLFSRR